jgi:hypothetical protein
LSILDFIKRLYHHCKELTMMQLYSWEECIELELLPSRCFGWVIKYFLVNNKREIRRNIPDAENKHGDTVIGYTLQPMLL